MKTGMFELGLADLRDVDGGGCWGFYVKNETTGELVACVTVYIQ